MPEYLAPGVYVEEVSFRSKTIEGVPTSTTGFAGMTRWGPVQYIVGGERGPNTTEPRLITSFTEFERVYGGLENLVVEGTDRVNFMAHAVRAFFMNGGKRLYVSRVYNPIVPGSDPPEFQWGIASRTIPVGGASATWRARWPGNFGNIFVETKPVRTKNVGFNYPADDPLGRAAWGRQAKSAKDGALVEIIAAATPADQVPDLDDPLDAAVLAIVRVDAERRQRFYRGGAEVPVPSDAIIQLVELRVLTHVDPERIDPFDGLSVFPSQRRYIAKILQKDDPEDEDAVVWLDWEPPPTSPTNPVAGTDAAIQLAVALVGSTNGRLTGGTDAFLASPDDLAGQEADPDDALVKATGLAALGEIDDIAIVALPDGGAYPTEIEARNAADRLITHAESLQYRIAIVDAPEQSSMTEVRRFRGQFDTKYAALYHPWIVITNPLERPAMGAPPSLLALPASGFVAGIYARTDIDRGVHKAPANEVVRGLTKFEANINKARNDVLNPEGINALRFFEGRGNRVWGARTMSSDPEWKYVNVRRLFIYLEHSIDLATQWAVFEPNNQRLWANIRQTVEDFLLVQWLNGALLGDKPEEAYFVRCDRTTMTQNDIDNGRMICLIGVAPTKPAEYVIFRIGQWTADAKV